MTASPDLAVVRALEARMMSAWPALETQFHAGWVVRAANGYFRRANSASALFPERPLDDATIDALVALMRAMSIAPCFRISPLAREGADAALAARGFRCDVATLTLVGPVPDAAPRAEPGSALLLDPRAEPAWIAANAAGYGGDKANAAHLDAIVSRIRAPTAFATLNVNDEPVAWGIGVAVDGWLTLQDIVVRPDRRGRGYGGRVVEELLVFGRRSGARRAFLQVREDNTIARALYAARGFETAYAYHHRAG